MEKNLDLALIMFDFQFCLPILYLQNWNNDLYLVDYKNLWIILYFSYRSS